jgi:hypothetical protein
MILVWRTALFCWKSGDGVHRLLSLASGNKEKSFPSAEEAD